MFMYRVSSMVKLKQTIPTEGCEFENNAMPYVANALLLVFMTWHCTIPSVTLKTTFTQQPLLGYRCVLGNPGNQTTWLNTARAQCVWRCLSSDECVVVNHNHRFNRCELSTQLCDSVVSNPEFSVNLYGTNRKFCSNWVSNSGYNASKAVAFASKLRGRSQIAVARKEVNADLYPGKCKFSKLFTIIIAMDDDTVVSDDRGEILQVDSACLWTWVAYTSSNVLPVGAVAGGHDVSQEPLYVARAIFEDIYSIGYYKFSKLLGYFVFRSAVNKATTMEILVIL